MAPALQSSKFSVSIDDPASDTAGPLRVWIRLHRHSCQRYCSACPLLSIIHR